MKVIEFGFQPVGNTLRMWRYAGISATLRIRIRAATTLTENAVAIAGFFDQRGTSPPIAEAT
jgi:hypothetical protein